MAPALGAAVVLFALGAPAAYGQSCGVRSGATPCPFDEAFVPCPPSCVGPIAGAARRTPADCRCPESRYVLGAAETPCNIAGDNVQRDLAFEATESCIVGGDSLGIDVTARRRHSAERARLHRAAEPYPPARLASRARHRVEG
jgi:hypothetical protein